MTAKIDASTQTEEALYTFEEMQKWADAERIRLETEQKTKELWEKEKVENFLRSIGAI